MKNLRDFPVFLKIAFSVFLLFSCFTTLIAQPPIVTTDTITAIGINFATGGGNVINDMGYTVTARGVCWSTTSNPTTANNFTTDGSGMGIFTSSLTGLSAGTTYFVRAYATNLMYGTGYGNEVSFTTNAPLQLSITMPVNGTLWTAGQTYQVVIHNQDTALINIMAKLYLSENAGDTWTAIADLADIDTGNVIFNWQIDQLTSASASCMLAVSSGTGYDMLWPYYTVSGTFEIQAAPSSITVIQPVADALWLSGEMHNIAWMSVNVNQAEKIQYSIDGGTNWIEIDTVFIPVNGPNIYSWSVPYVEGYKKTSMIRVISMDGSAQGSSLVFALSNLITMPASIITQTTAESGGNVTNDGGFTITDRGVCWDTLANPTIADSWTSSGLGIGNYTSSLNGLLPNTKYYLRAYTSDGAVTNYGNEFFFNTLGDTGVVVDVDGNTYSTIMIGTQLWMRENLGTARLNDGTLIPLVTDSASWTLLSSPGYCWYNNDSVANNAVYGKLYNWHTGNTGKLCPVGWHVPTDGDWKTLEMFIGLSQAEADASDWRGIDQGIQLKNSFGWNSGGNGTNSVGFAGQAGGTRNSDASFANIGNIGNWWSSSEFFTGNSWYRQLSYNNNGAGRFYSNQRPGFSVRCLKDTATLIVLPTLTTKILTGITINSATTGGDILSDGGDGITARGVCWSTNPNPTISDSLTIDGAGTGLYTSVMTGLTPGTTYYIKAYATNGAGTAYGNELVLTTLTPPEQVFNVDMSGSGLTIGQQVFISGTFGGINGTWDQPGTNPNNEMLDPESDGIYTITLYLPDGPISFKFFIGPDWNTGDNAVPDRTYLVSGSANLVYKWGVDGFPVSEITIASAGNATTIETNKGTLQMSAAILPVDATNQTVNWTVTNGTGKASISTNGLLVALENGTVTVTATSTDGSNVSASMGITLSNQFKAEFPINFETSKDTIWEVFGNFTLNSLDFLVVGNPDKLGINPSDSVLKFVVNDSAEIWAGAWSESFVPLEFTESAHTLTMMVFKSIISPTVLKVEASTNGGPIIEAKVSNTLINQWELLTFDFSPCIGYSYPRLVIFPDFPDIRTSGTTVYLDNITAPTGIDVIQPSTGVYWQSGTQHNIEWTNLNVSQNVNLQYSTDGGMSWTSIASNILPVNGFNTYTWTVGNEPGIQNNSLVRVITNDGTISGISNIFTILPGSTFAGGSGTLADPLLIATPEQLNNIRLFQGIENSAAHFLQTANIDLGGAPWNLGEGWEPIGNEITQFYGKYNGNGFTISGLTINRPDANYIGLFGWAKEASLSNIGLVNVDITGNQRVAALAAKIQDNGYVGNCYSTGNLTGQMHIAGLVADPYLGTILENCYSAVNVHMVPGISANSQAGGLVARTYENSFIYNCYATGTVDGPGYAKGGLIGLSTNNSTISNCYSTGTVFGEDQVGGLLGGVQNSIVTNCYSTGKVNYTSLGGGLIGDLNIAGAVVTNSYWNTETSSQSISALGEPKNSLEMSYQSTFSGWAFDTIWNINEGSTFPYLKWQVVPGGHNFLPSFLPPSNLTAIPGIGSVALNWTAPSIGVVTEYKIYRDSSIIGTATTPGYTDGGLTNYITYNYYITANYNTDVSEPSNRLSLFLHTGFSGGDGSALNPYLISSAGELYTTRLFLSSHFMQVANINLGIAPWNTGKGWDPIGKLANPFTGTFNGNGFTISNLTINRPLESAIGLFGSTNNAALIENVNLDNVNIAGNQYVGPLAGDINSTNLINISVSGTTTANIYSGGIVGGNWNNSTINKSHSSGILNSTGNWAGGLSGVNYNGSLINNSYSNMVITSAGSSVGGLSGTNEYPSTISNSYFLGSVSGNMDVGGITGLLENSLISSCYSIGTVTGTGNAGGLVGNSINNGIVKSSYWNKETSGLTVSAGGEGRTSDEMIYVYAPSTYSNWDFINIWADDPGYTLNNGYPYLRMLNVDIPSVLTDTMQTVASSWAKIGGNVTSDGGVAVTSHGHCWNTGGRPTISGPHTDLGAGTGTFVTYPSYLNPNTIYYIRSYATNSVGTAYGNQISFTTLMGSGFAGGSGTQADPYLIATAEQLNNVRFFLGPENSGVYFLQTANIDLGVAPWNQNGGWEPIGNDFIQFYGKFNGNGFTITGLTIDKPDANYLGLFGWAKGSSFTNIGLVNVNITGNQRIGALAGKVQDNGFIGNCFSTGIIKGQIFVAGLVANLYYGATIENSYSSADVLMIIGNNQQAGGLVARASFKSSITNSFATGNVSGIATHTGGLVGYVTDSTTISNSYATGEVTGDNLVGGLIGSILSSTISNCYSVGRVSYTASGNGFAGYLNETGISVTSCYWNTETSGQEFSAKGIAKNTPLMITSATFAGWAFDTIWSISEGATYPYLQWQTAPAVYNFPPAFIPPSNLSATPNNSSISLTWQAPSMGTVIGYNIYRDGSYLSTVTSTSFVDGGLTNYTSYSYYVTSVFISDESLPSNTISLFPHSGFSGGDGSDLNPYLISNPGELYTVRLYLNSCFRQIANIDLGIAPWNAGEGWQTIGKQGNPFKGKYNGDGYTISNLTLNKPGGTYLGLFGLIDSSFISNVILENLSITGGSYGVGGLAGEATTSYLSGISINGAITALGLNTSYIGGIVGSTWRLSINECHSSGIINTSGSNIGGITGDHYECTTNNSFSTMSVTSSGNEIGGLSGSSTFSKTSNSYFLGTVSGFRNIGGIVGYADTSLVTNCYSKGSVVGSISTGGLVGTLARNAAVDSSYWNTETSGQLTSAGGMGRTSDEMTFTYNTNTYEGWDFGAIWAQDTDYTINNGYPYLRIQVVAGTAGPNSTICTGTSASMTLTGSLGSIQWQESADGTSGWINVIDGTGGNSENYLTGILNSTSYYRAAITQPGFSTAYSNVLMVSVMQLPSNPSGITGLTTVCQGQNQVAYKIPVLSDASTYIWTLPAGASGTSTVDSIKVDFGTLAISGNITVKGNNTCGDGTVSTLPVTVNPLPESPGPILGPAIVCQGQTPVMYNVVPVANAISYVWTLPTGAGGTSTTNIISVGYGSSAVSGNITVKGTNTCGDGVISTRAVAVNPLPAGAGSITGTTVVCQSLGTDTVSYSVPVIANASSYNWSLPVGATGMSTTNSIKVFYGASAVSGNITVKGANSCGEGILSTLVISVDPLPEIAGAISGEDSVCQGQNTVIYSVPAVANASSYVWTLPAGATGTSSTNSISVDFGNTAVSGDISVKGKNSCGEGAASVFAIMVNLLPADAGIISGLTIACQGQNSVIYTVPAIANATSYTWTLPPGVTGTSTTSSITVDFGTSSASGNITVKGNNPCGDGLVSSLAISVNPLTEGAGVIAGLGIVCQGQIAVAYTVPPIGNATSYLWTLPAGATGTSTINSINVDFGTSAISGNVSVKGEGTCGSGEISTLAINVNEKPATPMISSNGKILHSNALEGNQWFDQTGLINGAINQDFSVTSDGDYYDIVTFLGCSSEKSNIIPRISPCEARFDYSWSSLTGFTSFTDMSVGNPTGWSWNFGDGTYSKLQNPVHNYVKDGVYTVTLNTLNELTACISSITNEVIAINVVSCEADFDFVINSGSGLALFTSKSQNATGYYWDFGDGEYSTDSVTAHTYDKSGIYQVCLNIWNAANGCQSISCKNLIYIPEGEKYIEADFTFFTNTTDNNVILNDLSSTNTTNWYWTMGDGKVLTEKSPVYTYSKAGIYNVCLTVFDQNNSLTASVCKTLRVGAIPCEILADYTYFINPAALEVTFFSLSKGAVDNYFWDFGDGSSSALESPSHQYSVQGYYEVELSVINSTSNCVDEYSQFIQVGNVDCRAGFTFRITPADNSVNFIDDSKGQIDYYYWDFDNGEFSVEQNPVQFYDNAGIYMVDQFVIDNINSCVDYFVQPVQVGEVDCSADYISYIDSSNYTAYFTNRNLGASTALLWSFGDGSFSTLDNPVHEFPGEGIYSTGLNTYDFISGCMDYYEEMLLIGGIGIDCNADFIYRVDPENNEVTFINKSIGDIDEFMWDFGDINAENSTETNPVYLYPKGGYYNVCLTVTNSDGIRNMGCKWILIEGNTANDCRANFMFTIDSSNLTAKFVDNSYGDIDKYLWDFGDQSPDSISTDKNPIHTYPQKGYYLVQLKVENSVSGCISDEYKLLNIADNQILKAAFGYEAQEPDKKFTGYPVDLVSASSGDGATVEWDFGDKQLKKGSGNFTVMDSTSRVVRHYYLKAGKYEVCLRVSDPVRKISDVYCSYVHTKNAVGIDDLKQQGINLSVYPNPLVDFTTINYEIEKAQFIELAIYDPLGRRIETLVKSRQDAGIYQFTWNTKTIATGIYHLKMISESGTITTQLVISK